MADAPVSMSAGGRRICSVCCQAVAAYTCPRCHKAYCTSACYKQHGHQCTEAFYREQATSQMKATRADAEQTQQMMRILQRMHEQGGLGQQQQQHGGSSSDDSSEGSNEGGSDQDDDAAAAAGLDGWLAQSHEFQQLLQRAAAQGDAFEVQPSDLSAELADRLGALALSGRISHLLQPWRPWWASPAAADISLNASGQRVIAELTPNHNHQEGAAAAAANESIAAGSRTSPLEAGADVLLDSSDGCAALPEPPQQPLPTLAQLAGSSFCPSPLLLFELLQLLVAYCAVMHYWNGEPDCGAPSCECGVSEQGWEAAEQLLLLAPPLEQQAARLAISNSSSRIQQAPQSAKQQDRAAAAVHQQQQGLAVVADSVRCACMQLADAAGALHSELRVLLQQATADALALLQLGRAAVLLALTDSVRLLERGRRNLKLQRQQQKQQQQPARLQQRGFGKRASSSQQQQEQQQVLLEQQLKLACRKLVFFQVWCNEQVPALFEQLAVQLAVELSEQQAINTPAAAGVGIGALPVQVLGARQQQQQQQQPSKHQQQQHVTTQALEVQLQADAAAAQHAVNGQQQQHQQQHQQPHVSGQVPVECSQGAAMHWQQQPQQQQQQQQRRPQGVGAGSSAPVSDLYELD